MNVIVVIEGREAIPVRAIPLLTNWETMSSDALAMALAWDGHFFNFHKLQAFHLGDSQRPIPATWWENIACRELKALSDSIRAVEVTHETGLKDWRRKSLEVLPSGVFVWKDEFEPMHLCRYGVYGTTFLTASNGVMPREEQERRVALDFNPFILDAEIQRVIMDGFEPKTTIPSPTPEPQDAPVVAVGASGGVSWTLIKPQRFPGYRKPLYDLLRAAHVAGQPCPTARDVLDTWRNKRPLEVTEVMADGLKYYDAKGGAKPADLNAIRKAIGRMTR